MRLFTLAVLVALGPPAAAEEIRTYKWTQDGVTHYSDTKPENAAFQEKTLSDEANVVPVDGIADRNDGGSRTAPTQTGTERGLNQDVEGTAAIAEEQARLDAEERARQEAQNEGSAGEQADTGPGAETATAADSAAAASPAAGATAATGAAPAAAAPVAPPALPPPPIF